MAPTPIRIRSGSTISNFNGNPVHHRTVLCYCGEPARLKFSFTQRNYRQAYFDCDHCRFWKWMRELYPTPPGTPSQSISSNTNGGQRHSQTNNTENSTATINNELLTCMTKLNAQVLKLDKEVAATSKKTRAHFRKMYYMMVCLFAAVLVTYVTKN